MLLLNNKQTIYQYINAEMDRQSFPPKRLSLVEMRFGRFPGITW